MRPDGTKCPHADIRFCPLYLAAHVAGAGGCDDGHLGEGGCAVDRGMNYADEAARLQVTQFHLVAEAEYAERQDATIKQRARNMRAAGIH